MKILVVCAYKKDRATSNHMAPFIHEQMLALEKAGHVMDVCYVMHGGPAGYFHAWNQLRKQVETFQPDIIHAHYGLTCLLANLSTRKVPVVSTYHGSDINIPYVRHLSRIAMRMSAHNVFISVKQKDMAVNRGLSSVTDRCSVIPCGIDVTETMRTPKADARLLMHMEIDAKYVLFAGAFDNTVKDPDLAKASITMANNHRSSADGIQLLELKGYSREQVNLLMCAVDCLLMTSKTEGSPQVIKEAMACGCPIVSTNVGDVQERIDGLDGCYIADTRNPEAIAMALEKALSFDGKTAGPQRVTRQGLNNELVAQKITNIYNTVLCK